MLLQHRVTSLATPGTVAKKSRHCVFELTKKWRTEWENDEKHGKQCIKHPTSTCACTRHIKTAIDKKTPEKPTKFLKGGKSKPRAVQQGTGRKVNGGKQLDHRTQQALEKHQQRRSNRRARSGSRKKRPHRRGQGGRMEELLREFLVDLVRGRGRSRRKTRVEDEQAEEDEVSPMARAFLFVFLFFIFVPTSQRLKDACDRTPSVLSLSSPSTENRTHDNFPTPQSYMYTCFHCIPFFSSPSRDKAKIGGSTTTVLSRVEARKRRETR